MSADDFETGIALLREGHPERAFPLLDQAWAEDPLSPRRRVYRAWAMYQLTWMSSWPDELQDVRTASDEAMRSRARAVIQTALRAYPDLVEPWAFLAAMRRDEGDVAGAIETLQRALEHNSENEDARTLLEELGGSDTTSTSTSTDKPAPIETLPRRASSQSGLLSSHTSPKHVHRDIDGSIDEVLSEEEAPPRPTPRSDGSLEGEIDVAFHTITEEDDGPIPLVKKKTVPPVRWSDGPPPVPKAFTQNRDPTASRPALRALNLQEAASPVPLVPKSTGADVEPRVEGRHKVIDSRPGGLKPFGPHEDALRLVGPAPTPGPDSGEAEFRVPPPPANDISVGDVVDDLIVVATTKKPGDP